MSVSKSTQSIVSSSHLSNSEFNTTENSDQFVFVKSDDYDKLSSPPTDLKMVKYNKSNDTTSVITSITQATVDSTKSIVNTVVPFAKIVAPVVLSVSVTTVDTLLTLGFYTGVIVCEKLKPHAVVVVTTGADFVIDKAQKIKDKVKSV